jgi:hypothetical protein
LLLLLLLLLMDNLCCSWHRIKPRRCRAPLQGSETLLRLLLLLLLLSLVACCRAAAGSCSSSCCGCCRCNPSCTDWSTERSKAQTALPGSPQRAWAACTLLLLLLWRRCLSGLLLLLLLLGALLTCERLEASLPTSCSLLRLLLLGPGQGPEASGRLLLLRRLLLLLLLLLGRLLRCCRRLLLLRPWQRPEALRGLHLLCS